MQEKYPSGFSGRSLIIKRSDLGAKGVFYRKPTYIIDDIRIIEISGGMVFSFTEGPMTAGSTAMPKIGGALIAGLMLVAPRIDHAQRFWVRNSRTNQPRRADGRLQSV
jgi:hypothetical protein